MIEYRALGTVDLTEAGLSRRSRATPVQGKRLALLAYMAVARPRGLHSRDTLMALFWPEQSPDRARNALRQALFSLRRRLGKDVLAGGGKEAVGLAPDALWCDVVAFEEALEAHDLERAVELYQGEFLAGLHVSDPSPELEWWIDQERMRLRRAALGALRTLADREEAAGRPRKAAGMLRRAIELEPDDEPSVRRLMSLLDTIGDRAGAFQVYETLRARTLEEYGAEPAPETLAVARAIREREASPAAPTAPPDPRLPLPMTPLIGREREIRLVLGLLHGTDDRLVTLLGPGGSGKTRLSLEIASRYGTEERSSTHLVELASLRRATLVLPAIARAVGAVPGRDPLESIRRQLERRAVLLVLDNADHLVDAALDVVELLRTCPGVKILTTSRTPWNVRAERRVEVPPLSLTDPAGPQTREAVEASEAVALFVDRARAMDDRFRLTDRNAPVVARICRRLDGLPLAIELAASQIGRFTADTLLERLSVPLHTLGGGLRDMPERHRTLEATIGSSHDLLSEQEREVFRRLALFTGGAPLEAAGAMWEAAGGAREDVADVVGTLIDRSLARRIEDGDGRTRITMLETIREFALGELERCGETKTWWRWQAEYWLSWVEPGEGYYCTLEEPAWLDRLEREHDNLRGVLEWSITAGDPVIALRLAVSLWHYWWQRGYFREGRTWLERGLEAAGPGADSRLRGRGLFAAGSLASGMGEHERAVSLMEESLGLILESGDRQAAAVLLQNMGYAVREHGDLARARTLFEEALALRRETGDLRGMATALDSLGHLALQAGELEEARRLLEESLELGERTGHRERVAHVTMRLAELARREGDDERAGLLYERSLQRYRGIKHAIGIGESLSSLADLALARGAHDRARELYAEALMLYRDTGADPRRIATSVVGFAMLALMQNRPERATRLCGGADVLMEERGLILDPADARSFEATIAALRRELGEEDFAAQWAAGRRMSADETITLALQLAPPGPTAPRLRRTAGH